MVYLPTQPNAPGGHARLTIGPQPPEVMGPPAMPVPHAQATPTPPPVADKSLVKPNRRLATAAVNQAMANRTQSLANRPTPQPSAAPPSLAVTGHESPQQAKAKLACWTLAEDLTRICARAALGKPADVQKSLAALTEHTRRLLGNSFAGGMIVGLAEQAAHLISTGASPTGAVTMVCLGAAQFLPPLAAPLNTALALIGGAEATSAFVASCRSLGQGNNFAAGQQASKALLAGLLARVANAERGHAVHALKDGQVAINPFKTLMAPTLPEAATVEAGLTSVISQCRYNRMAAKELLKPGHGPGGHGPSPTLKSAHAAESSGRLGGNHHADHGHEADQPPHSPAPKGKPAAHH